MPCVLARRLGVSGFLLIDPNSNSVRRFSDIEVQMQINSVSKNELAFEGLGPQIKLFLQHSVYKDTALKDPAAPSPAPNAQFVFTQGVMHFMDVKHHRWLVSRDGAGLFACFEDTFRGMTSPPAR